MIQSEDRTTPRPLGHVLNSVAKSQISINSRGPILKSLLSRFLPNLFSPLSDCIHDYLLIIRGKIISYFSVSQSIFNQSTLLRARVEEHEKQQVVASTHGSPWSYDTYVPIAFGGMNIPAQHVVRRVLTVDIAATLAAYLGIKPPSGSVGVPLKEVFIDAEH